MFIVLSVMYNCIQNGENAENATETLGVFFYGSLPTRELSLAIRATAVYRRLSVCLAAKFTAKMLSPPPESFSTIKEYGKVNFLFSVAYPCTIVPVY